MSRFVLDLADFPGDHQPPSCGPDRPEPEPAQVRLEQMHVGARVRRQNRKLGPDRVRTVTSEPYKIDNNLTFLAATWWIDLDGRRESMADMGVIPYASGVWNLVNWCELVEDEDAA